MYNKNLHTNPGNQLVCYGECTYVHWVHQYPLRQCPPNVLRSIYRSRKSQGIHIRTFSCKNSSNPCSSHLPPETHPLRCWQIRSDKLDSWSQYIASLSVIASSFATRSALVFMPNNSTIVPTSCKASKRWKRVWADFFVGRVAIFNPAIKCG